MSKVVKGCNKCGNTHETTTERIADGRGKYCSQKCARTDPVVRAIVAEKAKDRWNNGRYSRTRTADERSRMKEGHRGRKLSQGHIQQIKERMIGNRFGLGNEGFWKGKRMPDEVKAKIRLKARKGPSSPMWKGGVTPLRKRIRELYQYKEWRQAVFERDGFTCVCCKAKPGYVEADHFPVGFAAILRENGIRSTEDAINCKLLWDTSNGRTICEPCHLKHTKISGQYQWRSQK